MNETATSISLNSFEEAMLLMVDMLRYEKPVFYDAEHGLITTGSLSRWVKVRKMPGRKAVTTEVTISWPPFNKVIHV